jgi:hypothetical protein
VPYTICVFTVAILCRLSISWTWPVILIPNNVYYIPFKGASRRQMQLL